MRYNSLDILDKINGPEDVKTLSPEKLPELCREIRQFMMETVAETGGHLASNLGAVELTVAIHRVYDTSRDRLVFDVGHQSYVHKILTGRREQMHTLRQLGGISGFPKPSESVHDACIAGHASTSISTSLGMARARTLTGGDYDIVAVIGDGALTGGLAYEGLSDAGQSGEPLVILLNDNGMSIEKNVGGMARMLSRLRVRPGYLRFKRSYRQVTRGLPRFYAFTHRIKEWIKARILPSGMFDEMGFYYIGPVDGHDMEELESVLRWAKELRQPVIIHAITQKGRGYDKAEAEPNLYHGVGPFNPELGVERASAENFSSAFGGALCRLAQTNDKIVAITAAMAEGTGLSLMEERFPARFFDVGIAEEHAVTMASGMARQGLRPVVAIYSTFLQRAYDMLIHDIALQNLPVVFGVDRAGIVGRDGETHNGVFDVAYLSSVPGMEIFCPSSYAEVEDMLKTALCRESGPSALRYPRGKQGAYTESAAGNPLTVLRSGTDITLVTYGILINNALAAAERLAVEGVSAQIIKLNKIYPLETETLLKYICSTGRLLVAEDVCESGCVGGKIEAALTAKGAAPIAVRLVNLGDGILPHGSEAQLQEKYGLDAESLAKTAACLVRNI